MMKLFRFFLVTALCIWSSIVQGQSNSGFQLAEDMEVTLELGDLYMNCGGALVVSESDMKSLIFDKLGQSGLTKQEFENAFDLDREGGQWARRYYKSSTSYKLAVREKEQVAMNYISSFTADNNWFGRVSYTPYNGTSKVLVWYLTDDSQTGGMSYRLYEKLREISGANSWSRGENTKRVSTVVRFGNKGTDKSIWVTLLLREGKIHFEYCTIENRDPSKWSDNVNTNVISLSSSEEKNIVLTNYWTKPDQMVRLMGEQRYFSKFIGSYGMSPAISFAFTYPIQGINSLYSASNNTWVVKGASGTSWTLTLRYHDNINDLGTSAIVAIKKDNMNYGPEEVAYLDGNNYDSYGRGVSNTTLHFCGVEDNSDQYPAAMDLINNPDYFVAYLKINIYHYCYDPIVDSPFFNVTVEGLGNQIEQEYLAEIQEMKKSCNELKATIDNKYSELTEGKLLVPYQLKTLQLYFIEYNEKIDDMLKKLDEAEENVKSISSEGFNELKSEISFYIQNISSDLFSPPVETYFTCSDGGMFRVDDIEVRNETKTISIFTDKRLYFDNIYVIPDEGYRIASLIIDNQETTKTQFDFDYAGSNFVAFFEPIPNTSPKREIKVKTAGTLSTLIPGSEKYYIKELILTGELNGTDFRLLRDMAGNNYLGQNTSGKLKVLDLSNAKVVAGGESYLYTDHIKGNDLNSYGSFYYQITENDVFPDYVFYGCYLEKIDIPNSTKSIGNSALSHCSGLTTISIPNSVQAIGDYAFSNCSGVSSVTIPKSVTDIGINPFTSCRGLSSIKVENGNDVFDSRNNCNAIISSSNNELIVGCNKTVIPNSVTSIGNSSFAYCSDITSITIPNSVKNIELSAFFSCSGLTTIVFPNSVTTIGGYAFQGCSGLTSITIPNSVKSIGDNAFSYCIYEA